MKNTAKRNVLVSALLAICLCVSLIAGATFALFTSESKVNIAVSSGKVNVVASAENFQMTHLNNTNVGAENSYAVEDNTVAFENIVPGDKLTFDIRVHNDSTVLVKYRTMIACESDDGLFAGLKITIGKNEYDGRTSVTAYETLNVGSDDAIVSVSIELPEGAGNAYQDKSCKIIYKVEAVQGNAEVENVDDTVFEVYTASDLAIFAKQANNYTLNSSIATVRLMDNITITGDWTTAYISNRSIDFDGNGMYITGLNKPLLNCYGCTVTVRDLTIKDSTISANSDVLGCGAILEQAQWCNLTMDNCHVSNTDIISDEDTRYGFMVGYLIGGGAISECTVEESEIKVAAGAVGGIVGHEARQNGYLDYLTLSECTVVKTQLHSGDSGNWRVGAIIGTIAGANTTVKDCSYSEVKLSQTNKTAPGHDLFGRKTTNAD